MIKRWIKKLLAPIVREVYNEIKEKEEVASASLFNLAIKDSLALLDELCP